jgi:hypothetical protein
LGYRDVRALGKGQTDGAKALTYCREKKIVIRDYGACSTHSA